MAKLVRRLRQKAGLPAVFALDACRHGGMTELEEAELNDGRGRALSAHKSRAYEGYAKRTWSARWLQRGSDMPTASLQNRTAREQSFGTMSKASLGTRRSM